MLLDLVTMEGRFTFSPVFGALPVSHIKINDTVLDLS